MDDGRGSVTGKLAQAFTGSLPDPPIYTALLAETPLPENVEQTSWEDIVELAACAAP